MINLEPDQVESINKVEAAMRSGKRSILLQGATGSGKSYIGSEIIRRAVLKDKTVWFLVPRRELIRQMHKTFEDFGIEHGYIASGYPMNPFVNTHICSVDSLRSRLLKVRAPNLAFIDETHFGSDSLDAIIKWLKANGTWIIGLSATPWKLSGKGLGCWYDELIIGPSIKWLIENKRLSQYRAFAPNTPDLSNIGIVSGDYSKGQLAERMEQDRVLIGNSVKHYKDHAMWTLGITFGVSRKHSEMLAESYRDAGIPAMHMDGDTPEDKRIAIARACAKREILQICNCDLLTFGYDIASASGYNGTCIQTMTDCQPTLSTSKQKQKNGRFMRYDGTIHTLFDHAGNIGTEENPKHGMPCDEVEWTLEDRVKKRGGGGEKTLPVRECPKCHFCFHPAKICPNCKYEFPIEYREIKEVDGELEELRITAVKKEARQEQGKAGTFEHLVEIGRRRGYKSPEFWAKQVMRGRKR